MIEVKEYWKNGGKHLPLLREDEEAAPLLHHVRDVAEGVRVRNELVLQVVYREGVGHHALEEVSQNGSCSGNGCCLVGHGSLA